LKKEKQKRPKQNTLPVLNVHFVIIEPDASIALVLALSAVLFCGSNSFLRSYKNFTFVTTMADIQVGCVVVD